MKKLILCIILSVTILLPVNVMTSPLIICAEENDDLKSDEMDMRSQEVIKYYYRTLNGVLQYRRWNATRGYWIDATWLNVPEA